MINPDKLFRFWLTQGYAYRRRTNVAMQQNPQTYKDRLQHEYKIITDITGYVDYFLTVSDLVRWAKDNGIVVGPGRGSGASSLVCYLLRITEIDPLQFPMLFERFIDPKRTDLPDIDIDVEDERRQEIVDYAAAKYGSDKIANIGTFTRYKGRNSLDDIARVYNIPEWKVELVKSRLVERADGHPRFAQTLSDTFESNPNLQALVDETPQLELATRLEGNIRNFGVHPAGIVISSVPLDSICATYEKQSGAVRGSTIAYDKKDSEYLGLLKIDLLSLTTLSSIRATLEHIRATLEHIGMSINQLYQIPLDDPKVYEGFCAGDLLGIFQFEGMATRRVTKQIQPTKFMDLSDINALARPGGDDKAYIENKNRATDMPDQQPILRQHLEWTYGVIVYQEQILLLLRDLGNFEPTEVNRVRKIISAKEDTSVLNQFAEQFVLGAESNGCSRETAFAVWTQMLTATGYAFNISHSVSYSLIAYWQMWLKVYYRKQFYLGQLLKCPTDEIGRDRRRKLIIEAQNFGIKVSPPDLLRSQAHWTLEEDTLYGGFTAIKGIGTAMANAIVEWRENERNALAEWDDLRAIPGFGPGRVQTIKNFVYDDDPYDAFKVHKVLAHLRDEFLQGLYAGVPTPTHKSVDINKPNELVTYMGIIKQVIYKDIVEQRLKYGKAKDLLGNSGFTREEIIATLDDPDKLKYAVLDVEDEYGEPIRVRLGRKVFPRYSELLSKAKKGRDVIVVQGYVSDFGGMAVQIKEMVVIVP